MLRKALKVLFANTSVSQKQMELFNKLSGWWHPSGPSQVLFMYNYHRIQFLRKYLIQNDQRYPLRGMDVLDVGCGAGFLTQSLARLGGNVIGLDPNSTSFNEASIHKGRKQDLKSLKYENKSLEKFMEDNKNIKFDLITSMQVLQHVNNPQQFIKSLSTCTREGGLVMLSTIRRSASSWLKHIVAAETVLGIVPSGTHHHNKFINPQECEMMMRRNGYETLQLLQLELSWKGQFIKAKGGNNYLILGKKI